MPGSVAAVTTVAASARTLLVVEGAGTAEVNGNYAAQDPKRVPAGFARTCHKLGWPTGQMWLQLSDGETPWWESENESYIYRNVGDGKWWIDAPDGGGVYILRGDAASGPPASGWQLLRGAAAPAPTLRLFETGDDANGL